MKRQYFSNAAYHGRRFLFLVCCQNRQTYLDLALRFAGLRARGIVPVKDRFKRGKFAQKIVRFDLPGAPPSAISFWSG
jgi:hypothetical protein